ncbi:MAG: hypothetical protein QM784_13865 [Polyangiaceae bacterium]
MAKLGPAGKVRRLLEFLLGLRDDRVLSALTARGFSEADRAKGWDLLRALGTTQCVVRTSMNNTALDALDVWRREWIPLVHVSLEHGFADVNTKLFHRIGGATRPTLEVVPGLLNRLDKLERAGEATTNAALAKLNERGFTAARRAEGKLLLRAAQRFKPPESPDPEIRRAAIRQAEAALWAYYVEWSLLARTVIKDVRLLELLGFREGKSSEAGAVESDRATVQPEVTPSKRRTSKRKTSKRRTSKRKTSKGVG